MSGLPPPNTYGRTREPHAVSLYDILASSKPRLRAGPGGQLFVTPPALKRFWSDHDAMAHNVRRYAKRDFARLAEAAGLRLLRASYFMVFLSPLLWLSRLKRLDLANMDQKEIFALAERTHRVPAAPVNVLLKLISNLETPLGLWLPFSWGTSILGVFQKPS